MKRFSLVTATTLLVLGLLIARMILVPKANAAINRVIVVFESASSATERRAIVLKNGCNIIKELSIVPAVVVHLPEQASDRAREAILQHTSVVRIENDLIVEAFPKPDKPGGDRKPPKEEPQPDETLSWGVNRVDAELTWINSTGIGMKVAVLDTGIDVDHPDLVANLAGGINIINPKKHYNDDNGHGTHVAGIVAAEDQGIVGVDPITGKDEDGIGVIGVSPRAYLYGVKVLDRNGSGWLSDVVAGLEWCINNGMDVVNMSLGTSSYSLTFHEAIQAVYNAGIVQVAASGNDGEPVDYPAAYPETIGVSATDNEDNVTSWSNYGPEIDLTAPGVDINSTYKDGKYEIMSGTSMATPHVTGAVALILENQPNYTPEEVLFILTSTADDLGFPAEQQGAGLVDAEEAVLATE